MAMCSLSVMCRNGQPSYSAGKPRT
jgi:hypothetical protein